jgi:hypothetical protein
MEDANLAQKKQAGALGGLSSLNSTELSGGENALGLSNSALQGASQSAVNSYNNPWNRLLVSQVGNGLNAAMGGGG